MSSITLWHCYLYNQKSCHLAAYNSSICDIWWEVVIMSFCCTITIVNTSVSYQICYKIQKTNFGNTLMNNMTSSMSGISICTVIILWEKYTHHLFIVVRILIKVVYLIWQKVVTMPLFHSSSYVMHFVWSAAFCLSNAELPKHNF